MQRTALVVDDSRVARMTLKKLLGTYQFDVVELSSGEEAIEYLQANNPRPDIIFMDVMMGGIDGLAATQKIKSNPALSAIPIIICTGNDTEEDKNKALKVGAVTALTKPPVANVLANILAQVESSTPAPVTATDSVEPHIDEAALVATVLATIEKTLLPKVNQNMREIAEDISQQIMGDMAENLVEEQVDTLLKTVVVDLAKDLTAKVEQIVEKTAQQVCTVIAQESVMDVASQAVQTVVDEADIPTQVSQFLSDNGEEWLEKQEEDLGTQLSAQLEQLIPSICSEYLEANLTTYVLAIVNENNPEVTEPVVSLENRSPSRSEIEELVSLSLHQHTNTVVNPIVNSMVSKQLSAQVLLEQDEEAIDTLTDKVSTLQHLVLGLGVVVVGLLIAIIM